jgi:hypothetical protein
MSPPVAILLHMPLLARTGDDRDHRLEQSSGCGRPGSHRHSAAADTSDQPARQDVHRAAACLLLAAVAAVSAFARWAPPRTAVLIALAAALAAWAYATRPTRENR